MENLFSVLATVTLLIIIFNPLMSGGNKRSAIKSQLKATGLFK